MVNKHLGQGLFLLLQLDSADKEQYELGKKLKNEKAVITDELKRDDVAV